MADSNYKTAKGLLGIVLFFIIFINTLIFVPYFIVNQYHDFTLTEESLDEKAGVLPRTAIIPGSGVRPDGTPGTVLASRLDAGFELYQKGAVNRIILSGYNPSGSYNEPEVMKAYLISKSVPAMVLVKDDGGHDTLGTCQSAVNDLGIDNAIMVTQPGHLDRTVYLCRSVGMEAYGYEANVTDGERAAFFQTFREAGSNIKAVFEVTVIKMNILSNT